MANPFPVADGFSSPAGDGGAVTAAATGKVVAARPVVVIEHIVLDGHDKRRVRTRYGRLSRVDVRVGQIVRRGAVIGAAGPGAALQFDIRSGTKPEPDAAAFVRAHARLPNPAAEKQLVLIDQQRFRMQVRVDGRVRRDVEIGLGQAAGQKRREGDLRTPKGIYFVVDKLKGKFDGPSAEYFGGYWIKINYPGATDAAWGLREGVIDAATARDHRRRVGRAQADAADHAAGQRHRFSRLGRRVEGAQGRRATVVRLRGDARPGRRRLVRGSAARNDNRDLLSGAIKLGFMAKTALVTGANRGIGLALARRLKAGGRDVIAVCRKSSRELDALGVRVEADVDVTSDAAVAGLARRIEGVALDELVYNAGVLRDDRLDDVDLADVRELLEVNAIGPLRVVRRCAATCVAAARSR